MHLVEPELRIGKAEYYGRRLKQGGRTYWITLNEQKLQEYLSFNISNGKYHDTGTWFALSYDDVVTLGKAILEMAEDFNEVIKKGQSV